MMLQRFLQQVIARSRSDSDLQNAKLQDSLGLSRMRQRLLASTRNSMARADASCSAWTQATTAHMSTMGKNALAARLAPVLSHFGPLHLSLAETVWDNRVEIRQSGARRIFHISSPIGLVAVLSLDKQLVQIRNSPVLAAGAMQGDALSLRLMPVSASLLDSQSAQGFSNTPLAALLWHYGQGAPAALHHMPSLGAQILHVHRLPPLDPASLLLRHLRLIHQLAHQPMDFTELSRRQDEGEASFLCADLTSLYLTGCLSLRAPT